jgi:hypothetical protein
MELTVLIPPFGSPYGLKVYTCPKCARITVCVAIGYIVFLQPNPDSNVPDLPPSDAVVKTPPDTGGVTVGPRQNCRMVTTMVERDDGRTITRKERRCD